MVGIERLRVRARAFRLALAVVPALLGACGESAPSESAEPVQPWIERLTGPASERDAALVALRARRPAPLPLVTALLDDPGVAKAESGALVREELVFILGEAGESSTDAQQRLIALLANTATPVREAVAAARGLVVSWRLCRDAAVLESYVALRARVRDADDLRKAQSVDSLVLTRCAAPWEPAFVRVLRQGAREVRSASLCVACLRRYTDHQKELLPTYREVAQVLENAPVGEDASAATERLAVRELVGAAIAATKDK